MSSQASVSSFVRKFPSHLQFDCFDPGKVLSGMTLKNCENRTDFVRRIAGSGQNLLSLNQVHGDKIAWVKRGASREIPATDALVTRDKHVIITVRTADCVPVFLFDPVTSAIGLVHAGWKGARLGIAAKTVRELFFRFGVKPENLMALLGPSIRSCCYEFEPDYVPEFKAYMTSAGNKFHFDLPAYLTRELIGLNIPAESIFDTNLCTFCQPEDFFSYRRDPASDGRMVSFMMLQ